MEMIQHGQNNGCPTGAATWIAKALKVEEAQIILAMDLRSTTVRTENQRLALLRRSERLHMQVDGLMQCAVRYIGEDLDDILCHAGQGPDAVGDEVEDDLSHGLGIENVQAAVLPLPSYMDGEYVDAHRVRGIADMELELRVGQANDVLHELRLALADKAIIFRTDIRGASNYQGRTRAWGRVAGTDGIVKRRVAIYRRCRMQMISLGADEDVLARFRELRDTDLAVSTAIADPNARGHRNDTLAWFWTMDVPRDTSANNWMSECMLQPQ